MNNKDMVKDELITKYSLEQRELYNIHSNEDDLVSPNVQMPKYLYRYRQFSDREINSILNDTLWLSKPKSFKDILDSSLNIDFASSEENLKNFVETNRKKLFQKFSNLEEVKDMSKKYGKEKAYEMFEAMINLQGFHEVAVRNIAKSYNINDFLKENLLICCLTSDWKNAAMWEAFANGSTGFCIRYKLKDVPKYEDFNYRFLFQIMKVKYTIDKPKYKVFNNDFGLIHKIGLSNEKPFKKIHEQLLSKPLTMSYQKEWRLLTNAQNIEGVKKVQLNENGASIYFPLADRIILGIKIDINFEKKILAIAKEKNICVVKQFLDRSKSRLSYKKIFTPKIIC